MKVKALSEIQSARGTIPAGKIIDISAAMVEKFRGKVEPLDATQCRFWNQVCEFAGSLYLDSCTATADSHCPIFRFLEVNT